MIPIFVRSGIDKLLISEGFTPQEMRAHVRDTIHRQEMRDLAALKRRIPRLGAQTQPHKQGIRTTSRSWGHSEWRANIRDHMPRMWKAWRKHQYK